jgi:hypothetical protein
MKTNNHRDHDCRFTYTPRTITILGFLIAPHKVIAERVRTVSTKLHIYVFIAVSLVQNFTGNICLNITFYMGQICLVYFANETTLDIAN